MDPDPQTRTATRTRRRSACHRHPNEPVTGLCALCLRDRLTVLDSSTDHLQVNRETIVSFPLSRRTRGCAGGSSSGTVPEFRRSKSVAVEKCEVLNDLSLDLRRKSCDVRVNNRLTDLFDIDDTKTGGDVVMVESKNLGFASIKEQVIEIDEDHDAFSEVRVSNDLYVRNEVDDNGEVEEEEEEEEDLMTMKEHIEMELQNRKKKFWETASVFGQKLHKWRQKHKEKKQGDNNRSSVGRFKDPLLPSDVADYGLGRRSCDAAPRFSIDAHCMSVEDPQFSYDEHRASWDGYMIARTIPRLTPMLPIVDDMILPPVNKRINVKEEGSSSGASAKSNSDLSLSNTESSSSSVKSFSSKTAGLEGSFLKSVSRRNDVIGQETKLVITEREFNDWHLSSVNDNNLESGSNAPVSAPRTVKNRWRKKVSSLWSQKSKLGDKKNGSYIHENGPLNLNSEIKVGKFVRNGSYVGSRNKTESHPNGQEGARHSLSDIESGLMRQVNGPSLNLNSEIKSCKLVRNSSYVGSRNKTESHPNGQEGARHSLSDLESGLTRLHLSTFGKSRKKPATSMATDG